MPPTDKVELETALLDIANELRTGRIGATTAAVRLEQLAPLSAERDQISINGGSEQGLRQSRDADKAKGTPALAAENEGATSAIASPSSERATDAGNLARWRTFDEWWMADGFRLAKRDKAEEIWNAAQSAVSATSPIKVGEKPLMMAKAFMGLKPVTATIEDAQDMARELIRIADRADATK